MEKFYKSHDIPFKMVLDQINVYTSLVREQVNSKIRKEKFAKRELLDEIEEIVGNSRRLKIIYCSSNNIQRQFFIGRNTTNRTTILPGNLDRSLKEVCIDYEQYHKDYRGYIQVINLILFQLKHRCQQTQNVVQAQHIFSQSLQDINRNTFKNADNCRTQSFLNFLNINRSFKSQQSRNLLFIEQNKEKADFIPRFLAFLREQSQDQDIAKYNAFLAKGSEEAKYLKLKLFQRLCNRARKLLNTSQQQELENPYSFSCTFPKLLPQSQELLKKGSINMDNTLLSETSSTITLTIFMTPEMFLKINRRITKDKELYQRIVREALQCLHCLDEKFGDAIDFIYTDLISQHCSQLRVGSEVYNVTGKGLYFTHFSQGVFGQKQIKDKSKYSIRNHFRRILQELEKEPKEKGQFYGAYPAISDSNTKRTKHKKRKKDYTNCSWCIDAILVNKSHSQADTFNVITFDFTLSNDNSYIDYKYEKSCKFFSQLCKKNEEEFAKFNFTHKIIALQSPIKWMIKRRSFFMQHMIKPQNVVIQLNSIFQFTFHFSNPIKDTQEEIYQQIRSRLLVIKQESAISSQQRNSQKEIRQY